MMTEKDMQKAETTGAITRAQPEDTVKRLALALQQNDIIPFSYLMEEDTLIVYNASMEVVQKVPEYLSYLKEDTQIHPEDRWKAI